MSHFGLFVPNLSSDMYVYFSLQMFLKGEVVIISEWGREIVDILYTGHTLISSREEVTNFL